MPNSIFKMYITEAFSGLSQAYEEATKLRLMDGDEEKITELYQQACTALEDFDDFIRNAAEKANRCRP